MTTGNLLYASRVGFWRWALGVGSRRWARRHHAFSARRKFCKDQKIFDSSIFCKRSLFRSTLHAVSVHFALVSFGPRASSSEHALSALCPHPSALTAKKKKYGQASRLISTSKLKASLLLHTWPINLVIFQESLGALWLGKSHLVEGFTLRCIQRFSLPDVATRHCRWRDNRYTRGPSNPVLSY